MPYVRISREEQEAGESALLTILESGNLDGEAGSSQPQSSAANSDGASEKFVEEEGGKGVVNYCIEGGSDI